MSRRNQPYLPLYVQDFLADEKLNECSAESTGVYIRLMCIMHKSAEYGAILLKQKDKQNENQILNFACKLSRQMPYDVDTIARALGELVEEGVLCAEEDRLYQKRMVRDGKLSDIRACAGRSKAARHQNQDFDGDFATAKTQANAEIDIENEDRKEIEGEGRKGEATASDAPGKVDIFAKFATGNAELLSTLRDFETMRNKIKKPMTDRAKLNLCAKLKRCIPPNEWIAALDKSIDHCWASVYKPDGGAAEGPGRGKAASSKTIGHDDAPTDFERDAIRRMMAKEYDDDP